MPFDRAALKTADRLWLVKFILRSLTAVFAIIAVGTFASIAAQSTYNFGYYFPGAFFVVFTFIPVSATLHELEDVR